MMKYRDKISMEIFNLADNLISPGLPCHPHSGKPYILKKSYNQREAKVQEYYYNNGWIVLKNGWPDLLCFNPKTRELEFIEVKDKKQFKIKKDGSEKMGLSQDQLRMHQYLKKSGIIVKIIHVD